MFVVPFRVKNIGFWSQGTVILAVKVFFLGCTRGNYEKIAVCPLKVVSLRDQIMLESLPGWSLLEVEFEFIDERPDFFICRLTQLVLSLVSRISSLPFPLHLYLTLEKCFFFLR